MLVEPPVTGNGLILSASWSTALNEVTKSQNDFQRLLSYFYITQLMRSNFAKIRPVIKINAFIAKQSIRILTVYAT